MCGVLRNRQAWPQMARERVFRALRFASRGLEQRLKGREETYEDPRKRKLRPREFDTASPKPPEPLARCLELFRAVFGARIHVKWQACAPPACSVRSRARTASLRPEAVPEMRAGPAAAPCRRAVKPSQTTGVDRRSCALGERPLMGQVWTKQVNDGRTNVSVEILEGSRSLRTSEGGTYVRRSMHPA